MPTYQASKVGPSLRRAYRDLTDASTFEWIAPLHTKVILLLMNGEDRRADSVREQLLRMLEGRHIDSNAVGRIERDVFAAMDTPSRH